MSFESEVAIALSALALWLLTHGLEYVGAYEKHKKWKQFLGIGLLVDFVLVMYLVIKYGLAFIVL